MKRSIMSTITRMILSCVLTCTTVAAALVSKEIIAADGQPWRTTFNSEQFQWPHLQEYLKLAPDFWPAIATPIQLEGCRDDDLRYLPCGSRNANAPNFLANADTNLRIAREQYRKLSEMRVTPPLTEVLDYLKQLLSAWTRSAETQLAFYRTGNVELLRKPVLPGEKPACIDEAISRIQTTESKVAKRERVRLEWGNCWNNAVLKQLGNYPKAAWHEWLNRNQVTLRYAGRID